MLQKGFSSIFIILGSFTLIGLAGVAYYLNIQKPRLNLSGYTNSELPTIKSQQSPSHGITSSGHNDEMVLKARDDLASLLNITPDSIQILKSDKVVWTDTCLGGPKHSRCGVKADIPGYNMIFSALGRSYEYHTGGEFYRKISE